LVIGCEEPLCIQVCYRTGLALIECLYEGEGNERKRVRNRQVIIEEGGKEVLN
jgi:hypothetical protein